MNLNLMQEYGKLAAERVVKEARKMPHFTDQHRPAKVKEIYRALKRDHPEYSAGKKARIGSSRGKGK
jgi:hypothetical protein